MKGFKHSEHPPDRKKKQIKQIKTFSWKDIGYQGKTSLWHLIGFMVQIEFVCLRHISDFV